MSCQEEKQIVYDIEGYDLITDALLTLINQYPGLVKDEKFMFSSSTTGSCKSFYPTSGAVVQDEMESITGHVNQLCQYPFTVLFRASGLSQKNRVTAKEWLDTFGRWLEKQAVILDGRQYVLTDYPAIQGTREIRAINRQSPAYLAEINEDKSEDWIISMVVLYRNEFDR